MVRKNEGIIAVLMILALVAFVVGSAIGISVSLGEHENKTAENNTTHVENVTVEMTSNINKHERVEFDYDKDMLDFNDNYTRKYYNMTT